jgi:hypothetical protein
MSALKRLWTNAKIRYPLGISLGALGGFAYYHFIGCPTGGCPLSSNLYLMLALGGFMGWSLVADTR